MEYKIVTGEALKQYEGKLKELTLHESMLEWIEDFAHELDACLVFDLDEDDYILVGWSAFIRADYPENDKDILGEVGVFVDEAVRGQGIANELVDRILKYEKSKGLEGTIRAASSRFSSYKDLAIQNGFKFQDWSTDVVKSALID